MCLLLNNIWQTLGYFFIFTSGHTATTLFLFLSSFFVVAIVVVVVDVAIVVVDVAIVVVVVDVAARVCLKRVSHFLLVAFNIFERNEKYATTTKQQQNNNKKFEELFLEFAQCAKSKIDDGQ